MILPGDLAGAVGVAKDCGFADSVEPISLGQDRGCPVDIRRINKFDGEDFLTLDLVLVNAVLEEVWSGRQRFDWAKSPFPSFPRQGWRR